MYQQFRTDVIDLLKLCQSHFRALSIVIVSTVILILFSEKLLPPLNWFGTDGYAVSGFVYFGLLPLSFALILNRMSPKELGLGLGLWRSWLPSTCIFLIIALPTIYLVSSWGSFQQYYGKSPFNIWDYLLRVLPIMIGWEFMFRSYMLFGLKHSLKEGAILLQTIPFTLMHLGKPPAETLICVFTGLLWGYICYRGQSFWPAVAMHLSINVLLTALSVGAI